MNHFPVIVSDSNLGELSARATMPVSHEWLPRRLQSLDDEVGRIVPRYEKPEWVNPPVHTETPDERADRMARKAEEELDGDPYPMWIHALAWLVLIGFSLGCAVAITRAFA